MQNSDSQKSNSKKSPSMSPYLASLSEMQVRKKVLSPIAFHAASVASKLFGGTNCTLQEVLSYVEDETSNKNKNQGGKLQETQGKGGGQGVVIKQGIPFEKPPKPKTVTLNQVPSGTKNSNSIHMNNLKSKSSTSSATDHLNSAFTSLRQAEKSFSFAEIRSNNKPPNFIKNIARTPRPSSSRASLGSEMKLPTGRKGSDQSKKSSEEPEPIPVTKLKSILKLSSSSNLGISKVRPKTVNKLKTTTLNKCDLHNKNIGDNMGISKDGMCNKKVTFLEKVEIHPVPYESRGSTEWQYNLLQQRENVLRNIFSGPRLGSLNDSFLFSNSSWGGPLDNWGFGITPNRIRRPPKPS